MIRSEVLTLYAALAVGRSIMRTGGAVAPSILGSMLTAPNDPTATELLARALAQADKEVDGADTAPLAIKEFYAEIRRITGADDFSDFTVRAAVESGTKLDDMGSAFTGKAN